MIDPLSQTYADARAAFLDVAAGAGGRVTTHPLPDLKGLEGEDLAIDVAEFGSADNDGVIIVVSGTHGVEGYLGSAIQRQHVTTLGALGEQASGDADGPTLVFIHALNPYGFSWVRRVNEDNVDLNRNFGDWSSPMPANPGYAEIADALVPASWSDEVQEASSAELMDKLTEVGMEQFQQIVSGGQFDHPDGVFYGGTEPVWSHRWVKDFLSERLENVTSAAIIDLHTGLGPWGFGEIISSATPDSETYARQCAWWGDVTLHKPEDAGAAKSVSASLTGDWLSAVPAFAPDTEITAIAIEYGTVDSVAVLQSLRADAVLHASGDPTTPEAKAIRDQVRAAFNDDDPAWLEACWPRYHAIVTAAAERLG